MNFKSVILFGVFNIFCLFGLLFIWTSSIETHMGCACNYWRCVNFNITLFPILLCLLCIGNLIFLVSYILFNIRGEIK
jgi:hypothetical protein